MKKACACLLLLFVLFGMRGVAETNLNEAVLDSMSQEQLMTLYDKIYQILNDQDAPWLDKKWISGKPVTLESGVYCVGKDIPAGRWTIQPLQGEKTDIRISKMLDETSEEVSKIGQLGRFLLDDSDDKEDKRSASVDLIPDTYFQLELAAVFLKEDR